MAVVAKKGNVEIHDNGMVEHVRTWLTEFPTVYPWNRTVGYDHPERYTQEERNFIRKTLVKMKLG